MLHLQIDPHRGIPVYRQIMDQIQYYIASGALKKGDGLPSIREMARTLRVNPTTVVKAYSELAHANVVELKHGKGAFISEEAQKLSNQEVNEALRRLARQLVVEAKQMGVPTKLLQKVISEEVERMARGGE